MHEVIILVKDIAIIILCLVLTTSFILAMLKK